MKAWTVSLAFVICIIFACVLQVECGRHKPNVGHGKKFREHELLDDNDFWGGNDHHWPGLDNEIFNPLDWWQPWDQGDDWLETVGKSWWDKEIERGRRILWETKKKPNKVDADMWLENMKKEFAKLHEEEHRKHGSRDHSHEKRGHENRGHSGQMHGSHDHKKEKSYEMIAIIIGSMAVVVFLVVLVCLVCRKKALSRQQVSAPSTPTTVSYPATPIKSHKYLADEPHTYANEEHVELGEDGLVRPPAYVISSGVPPPVYSLGPEGQNMDISAPTAPPSYSTIDVKEADKQDEGDNKPQV